MGNRRSRHHERDRWRAEVERLRSLIAELTDADDCRYDHHGYCQAHTLDERPCPHERAKELLAATRQATQHRDPA